MELVREIESDRSHLGSRTKEASATARSNRIVYPPTRAVPMHSCCVIPVKFSATLGTLASKHGVPIQQFQLLLSRPALLRLQD